MSDKTTLAEQQLLGCLLWREGVGLETTPFTVEDFLVPVHRKIWAAMVELREEGLPVNDSTIYPRAGCLASDLEPLANAVCTGRNLEHFSLELGRAIAERRAAEIRKALAAKIRTADDPVAATREAQAEIQAVRARYAPENLESEFDAVATRVYGDLRNGVVTPVLFSGVGWFDRLVMGWMPGEQHILAGRPGCGKTDLAVQLMKKLALRGVKSCFFSIEMTAEVLLHRVISTIILEDTNPVFRATIPDDRIRSMVLMSEQEARAITKNIDLHTRRCNRMSAVEPILRRAVENGAQIVFLDYLQLMSGEGRTRNEEIERISRGMRELVKELGISSVLLAQLNRAADNDERPPRLSDLKDSGAIEQDADTVVFLQKTKNKTMAMVAKGRNIGRRGIPLYHTGATHQFFEQENDHAK